MRLRSLILTATMGLWALGAGADQRIANPAGGYSVYAPDGWDYYVLNSRSAILVDTTGARRGVIGVNWYAIDTAFDNAAQWSKAMAHAWEQVLVERYPIWMRVVDRDSIMHDGLFAMYMNADYADTSSSAADSAFESEHNRFVGFGDRGYQLYIQTDYDDMRARYQTVYRPLIDSIAILRPNVSAVRPPRIIRPGAGPTRVAPRMVDILGRTMPAGPRTSRGAKPYVIIGASRDSRPHIVAAPSRKKR